MHDRKLKSLLHDMNQMMTDTEGLVHALAHDTGAEITKARSNAQRSLETARVHLRRGRRRSLRRAAAAAHSARQVLRDNPWTTLGVAAAVGLLVGALWPRR